MSAKRQKLLKDFMNVSGADKETAKHFLDACKDNLETAIAMYLDDKTDGATAKSTTGEENVRAPIPQTSGVLVDDPHYVTTSSDRWNSRRRARSVFDGFRDFKAETTQQEAILSSANPGKTHRLKRLEDLFRPPLELMHKGTLETAREASKDLQKWLMVNVQNVREFSCQVLNRDVWSKKRIQTLVKEHFIFWQVYNDSTEGDRFIMFYPVTNWPHVSILDPRTGERLAIWTDINTDNIEVHVAEFLAEHGTIEEDENNEGPPAKKAKKDRSLIDDSEDTQLAAAIAASLAETCTKPIEVEDEGYMISNDNSDVSDFDATTDEENLVGDSDSSDNGRIVIKDDENSNEKCSETNTKNGLIEETKIDEKFFSENDSQKRPENNQKNGETNEKSYKKVNSRLKVGTLENGKDMSSLTSDVYANANKNFTSEMEVKSEDLCRILVRFPDGSREEIKMESVMTVKDLSSELTRKGYPQEDYDLLTHFPRKNIYSLGMKRTLKESGLHPSATVFLEERET